MRLLLAPTAVLLLAGCGDPPVPTSSADERPFASVCEAAGTDGRVAVRGYLRLPDETTGTHSVALRLFETAAYTGTPLVVTLVYGYEPNQMASVPPSYTDADLRVFTADGDTVGYGDPVRVSGRVYEPSALAEGDLACGLENAYVEAG